MIKMLFSRAKAGMVLAAFLLSVSLLPVGQASSGSAPILLVTNGSYSGDPFGSYLGEILRAEGLNEFDTADLSVVTGSQLAQYPVVVLAETPLSSAQASLFSAYVSNGGGLVAMRPDGQIASLFGLGGLAGTQTDGYMAIDGAAQVDGEGVGQGLVTETLQVHGVSDLRLAQGGAVVVAWLYTGNNTATGYPAVVSAGYGSGRGVAFSYDLGESVVYTRQGNPSTASYVNPQTGIAGDVDGDGVYRTIDLFQKVGGGAGWVDLNKVPIPQADMQMRLFARLVRNLAGHSAVQGLPLPQLWYFPGTARTVLVATGDAHANPESYFQYEVASILKHHGVLTFYPAIGSTPTVTDVQSWLGQGFSFGIHPYWNRPDNYPPYSSSNLQQGYAAAYNWFTTTYGPYNIPMSATVRNHQVAWAGWTDSADYAASYGIGMDTSFYDWGTWLKKADGSWANGYITGSGLPMKFARSDGTLTTVYQQLTELVDEQLVLGTDTAVEGLTGSQAVQVSQQMIDASQGGYYSALVTQFHVDYYENGDPQVFAEGTLDYAYNNGVPILNADQWLGFTQTRHDANYSNVSWNGSQSQLSFNLSCANHGDVSLTTILPWNYGGRTLQSALVDGLPVTISQETINAVDYGFISTPAGNHSIVAYYSLPSADLSIAQSAPASVNANSPFNYTIDVANNGPDTAQTVQVIDTLPSEISYTDFSGEGWSCSSPSGQTVTCTLASLGVGTAPSLTLNVTAPAQGTTLHNSASVSSPQSNDPSPENNSSTADTIVTPVADISLTAHISQDILGYDQPFSYGLTITNGGPSDATNLTLTTDVLTQSMVHFVDASSTDAWNCDSSTQPVSCTLSSLPAGSSTNLTLHYQTLEQSGDFSNSFSVSSSTDDPDLQNNAAQVNASVEMADLTVQSLDCPSLVMVQSAFSCTVNMINQGPSQASSVSLSIQFMSDATYQRFTSSGAGWSCSQSGQQVTCAITTLPANSTQSITLNMVAPDQPVQMSVKASITSNTDDASLENNSAEMIVDVMDPIYLPVILK